MITSSDIEEQLLSEQPSINNTYKLWKNIFKEKLSEGNEEWTKTETGKESIRRKGWYAFPTFYCFYLRVSPVWTKQKYQSFDGKTSVMLAWRSMDLHTLS